MRSLVLTAPSEFELQDFPDLVPGPSEVVVAVRACGICGSDIHGMDGSTGRRVPPIVMGHEAAGEIIASGDRAAANGWNPGDRVTFDSTVFCNECERCQRGEINLCQNRQVLGVSCGDYRRHGCFADHVLIPAHILHRLPDSLSFEEAAFAEPLSVALHAVSRVPAGERAAVVGAGLIGLLVVQSLKAKGWSHVTAIEPSAARRDLALKLGADAAFSPEELPAEGEKHDAAFEVVGLSPTLATAVQLVKLGGHVCLVGNLRPTVDLPLQKIVTGEITLTGSCASAGEYPEALRLIAEGLIDVRALTSATAPLSEGGDWFHKLHENGGAYLKIILRPESAR